MLMTLADTFMTATRLDGFGQTAAAAAVPAARPGRASAFARLAAALGRLAG